MPGKAGNDERCWYLKNGIKARPANGSGAERSAGMPERHCLSHAEGGASCAAWQFRPRGTHRVGLFSLDFLWFFLVSRQERTLNWLFTTILLQVHRFKPIPPLQGLYKSFASFPKGLRPLLIIPPLRGLNHQTSSVRLPTSFAGRRTGS